MSVLKAKRTTSKAEFVNTANQLYVETLNFSYKAVCKIFQIDC